MPLDSIADLERRIRRLEMELDQYKHKFVAPDRTVKSEPPLAHIDHGSLAGLGDDDHPQYRKVADSIDHGALAGLGDDDHPQYLLTTGKAADSDKLDGVDITAFKGLDSLTDPGADRVLFWDESANTLKWLTLGDGLTITDTTILSAPVRYAVKAYRSASFSISGPGTLTTIPLDAEEYDTHSQHDNTTNSSRLTCKNAGLYVVTGVITFNATSLSAWNMVIRKNNTTDLIVESTTASSGGVYVTATVIVPLAVGDYIEMRGWHGLSTNVSLVVTNNYNVQLSMARISE